MYVPGTQVLSKPPGLSTGLFSRCKSSSQMNPPCQAGW